MRLRAIFEHYEKVKLWSSEESIVARLKLKGINGREQPQVEPSA